MPKKLVAKLPVEQASANRLARLDVRPVRRWRSSALPLVALDVPAKVGAGGRRSGRRCRLPRPQRRRPRHPADGQPRRSIQIALDQKSTAMPLVDVAAIRERLLRYGWVKDARVSRRLPDTLVIDIVERQPAALWQDKASAVADRCRRSRARPGRGQRHARPAVAGRPRCQCPGARSLTRCLAAAPTLKPQLVSATGSAGAAGTSISSPARRSCCRKARRMRRRRLPNSPSWTNRRACSGVESCASTFAIPGKMIVRLPRVRRPPSAPADSEQES